MKTGLGLVQPTAEQPLTEARAREDCERARRRMDYAADELEMAKEDHDQAMRVLAEVSGRRERLREAAAHHVAGAGARRALVPGRSYTRCPDGHPVGWADEALPRLALIGVLVDALVEHAETDGCRALR